MSANPRVVAARALTDIAVHGQSLRQVLAADLPGLEDGRDRAFVSAIVYASTRSWLRWNAALQLLLVKPLPRKLAWVQALLVSALAQLEDMDIAPHAVVSASVDACEASGHGAQRGLVNAILRRWLRERNALLKQLDENVEARFRLPGWLLQALRRDWPGEVDAIIAASNREASPMLRVNLARMDRAQYLLALDAAGIRAQLHSWIPTAIVLEHSLDVARLPGWADGLCSMQDGAAQLAAILLDAPPNARVLDACAAPGGKACHILERGPVALTALDRDLQRTRRVRENLDRLRLTCDLRTADALQPDAWWDGQMYDRILLDAPCSASGVLRRQPDVRLHRRASDIPELAAQQRRLLPTLWPMLAPGGILLYATCSLLRAENAQQIDGFLQEGTDAEAIPIKLPAGRADGAGWQILPGEDGIDGMFFALLRKQPGDQVRGTRHIDEAPGTLN